MLRLLAGFCFALPLSGRGQLRRKYTQRRAVLQCMSALFAFLWMQFVFGMVDGVLKTVLLLLFDIGL
jgi:hypothetical protein